MASPHKPSLLTLQVYEEITKTKKEEVDLETGSRRRFVEEEWFEVLDLGPTTWISDH